MRLALLTTLFAGILLLPGCYYDNEEELYPNTFCDTTNVKWSTKIEALVQTNCAIPGCHVPGGQSPNLSTYADVSIVAQDGRFGSVIFSGQMPSSGPLPTCQQEQVRRWLNNGAHND